VTLVATHSLQPGHVPDAQQVYNALDCCLTFEVFEVLSTLRNEIPEVYNFERALQAPAMEMMLRGFKIDETERQRGIADYKAKIEHLQEQLNIFAHAVWDKGLNPNSPKQLIDFFYGEMRLPVQHKFDKGTRKVSTNREALEKLELHFHARPIIATILALRDCSKRLSVLETEVDGDGRMRTSYNIAGTETWRWSSSANSAGTGTNLQNISPDLRRMFVADPGFKLCGIDLEQAESREVGWLCGTLFGDWSYLDACYGGDLHTVVCKANWKHLKWTGDPREDRAIADGIAYREYSFRDLAKKLGHGSNYYGQPTTMARHAKVPRPMVETFQNEYFTRFPGIPKWHRWTAQQLQTTQSVTTPFGVRRHFFGRPGDDTTLREAIAFSPQSSTALRLNLILWRIWKHMGKRVQILAQVHDAIYFQIKMTSDAEELALITEVLGHFEIPMKSGDGHEMITGAEAKWGWNWANFSDKNPDGLKKIKGFDTRRRTVSTPAPFLDRQF